jgi:cytochrome c oxidase assembly protein subunit 15
MTVASNSPALDADSDRRHSERWLRRFAWFTAICTLFLICSGGMVTSKGVGLAVPDWPTTFGYNMFLFPVSKWVGGILFEHTHRLIASTVGLLTIVLAFCISRTEERRWLRNLGWIALGAVVLQGVLGGLRVTLLKDEIGIFHACIAHAFLGLLVTIALATTKLWDSIARSNLTGLTSQVFANISRLALITTAAIYVQLILGATMRHQHRDLAIFDFPLAYGHLIPDTSPQRIAQINAWRDARALSDITAFHIWLQMAHRAGAVIVAIGVTATLSIAIRRGHELPVALTRACALWFCLVCTQLLLGAWTIWSNKAADVATAHVAVGAMLFGLGVAISALALRGGREATTPTISATRLQTATAH